MANEYVAINLSEGIALQQETPVGTPKKLIVASKEVITVIVEREKHRVQVDNIPIIPLANLYDFLKGKGYAFKYINSVEEFDAL